MANTVTFGRARFGTILFGENVDIVSVTVTETVSIAHEGGAGAIQNSTFRGLLALTQNPGLHARARSHVSVSDGVTQAGELYETVGDEVKIADSVSGQVTNRHVIAGRGSS